MVVPTSGKREKILKLIEEKDNIELKIHQLGEVLKINNVGMNESLVTTDGFPRNDIDVYQVRCVRQEIICLQNNLKQLIKSIEIGLEDIHAENRNPITKPKDIVSNTLEDMTFQRKAIALVTVVDLDGPGYEAGLKVRDEILEFGSINDTNFKSIEQLGEIVRHSQNQELTLKIKRDGNQLEMKLTPKLWAGCGLLGCKIVSLDTNN